MSKLFVIIPSVKNEEALPSIKAAIAQQHFFEVNVVVAGKSIECAPLKIKCSEISSKIHFDTYVSDKILPGTARNRCLEIVKNNLEGRPDDFVLFLDDDIVVPSDFAHELKKFLETYQTCVAVMGRVESRPANFWTKIIDYSNFWWLQVRHHIHNLGWLGAGATMIRFGYINSTRFREDLSVGEDTDFFMRIARRENKHLSVNSLVTCMHFHGRETFSEFISYQYRNGYRHVDWYSDGLNVSCFARQLFGASKTAISYNKKYLVKHPHVLLGVLVSFVICFLGTQVGSIKNKSNRTGTN